MSDDAFDIQDIRLGALEAVNLGIVVFDSEERIIFWNEWMVRHSRKPSDAVLGKTFQQNFPKMLESRLHSAIQSALVDNFPSLLSQTLNKSPFPLYASDADAIKGARIDQAIQVIPIRVKGLPSHCLVQVMDVSMAVAREKLLREQAIVLRSQMLTDGLTGIPNRRRFDEHLFEAFHRARRNASPMALIMIDIDHFKLYNDFYGHLDGDQCLIKVANALLNVPKRPSDIVARYGGEEFAVILPETDVLGACTIAETIRIQVEALNLAHAKSKTADHVTISLGLAAKIPERNEDVSSLIKAADQALYRAKLSGRNKVMMNEEGTQ